MISESKFYELSLMVQTKTFLVEKKSTIKYEDFINAQVFLKNHGYKIERTIEVGSLSAVFEALNIDSNSQVTIKLFSVEDEGGISRCINEATLIGQIDSPYVVKIKEFFLNEYQKIFCIVSEYCPGGNLRDYLLAKKENLSRSNIIDIFHRLLMMLIDIHSKNVILGNLKPENLVFNSEGKIFLTDLDFSHKIHSFESKQHVKTQPLHYQPQEQDEGNLVQESDYYSLGMILLQICRPQTSFEELILMKRGEFPADLNQSPNSDLLEIALSMMNINPKLRSSPSQVISKLQTLQPSHLYKY